jgi:hypothetical protein
LKHRGRIEFVSSSNCDEFVSLSITFRVAELQPHLLQIKKEFWENVGEESCPFLDWISLRFATCGEQSILIEALKKKHKCQIRFSENCFILESR